MSFEDQDQLLNLKAAMEMKDASDAVFALRQEIIRLRTEQANKDGIIEGMRSTLKIAISEIFKNRGY